MSHSETPEKPEELLLRAVIESYLEEQLHFNRLTLAEVCNAHRFLIGPSDPLAAFSGFVGFLERSGIGNPPAAAFNEESVGLYCEFIMLHFGCYHWNEAGIALRTFWEWCKRMEIINHKAMPVDLKHANRDGPRAQLVVEIQNVPFRRNRKLLQALTQE
jgi:hypothetical protein